MDMEDDELEIITNKKDDDDRPELRVPNPMERDPSVCQFCKHKGEMLSEFENSFLGYAIVLFLFLMLGLFAFLVIPFAVFITRSKVHRCPRCLNKVRENMLESLSHGKMSDQVWAFNLGSFGVILTRKYLLYMLLVALTIIGIIFVINSGVMDYDESQPLTSFTWEEYQQDCGPMAVALDRRKAAKLYY